MPPVTHARPAPTGPDLAVRLGPLRLKNPVLTASGTFGYGPEYGRLVPLHRLGAVVVKGISLNPAAGNPPPRLVETPSGLLNAIGLQNPGAEGFIRDYLPYLRAHRVPVIVNIWGTTLKAYEAVAARLDGVPGIHALEVNISCPNIKQGGTAFGADPRLMRRVLSAVRKRTRLPMIPKLAPNTASIAHAAQLAEACGADAISLVNSFPAMAIDIETRRPLLANVTGGLTGPAIHPIALKLVWEAARAVRIPVIGMGGIVSAREAIAFLIAGATAVAIGTSSFREPRCAIEVLDGLRAWLRQHGVDSVRSLVGTLETPAARAAAAPDSRQGRS